MSYEAWEVDRDKESRVRFLFDNFYTKKLAYTKYNSMQITNMSNYNILIGYNYKDLKCNKTNYNHLFLSAGSILTLDFKNKTKLYYKFVKQF